MDTICVYYMTNYIENLNVMIKQRFHKLILFGVFGCIIMIFNIINSDKKTLTLITIFIVH